MFEGNFASFPWCESAFIGLTIAIGAVVSMLRDAYLTPMLRSAGLVIGSAGVGGCLDVRGLRKY